MKRKLLSIGLVFAAIVSITGCATIVSGSTQKLHLQAIDKNTKAIIPNAKCTITDGKGNSYVINGNPGTVIVSRGNGSLKADCHASGYTQKEVGKGTSFNAWTIANILFWPGFIIDGLSGSYAKYPDHITVLMSKD